MAKNFHIVSATFGSQAMGSPQNARMAVLGVERAISAGIEDWDSALKLPGRHVVCDVGFNDWADSKAMMLLIGTSASLVVITQDAVTPATTRTTTIANCTCANVIQDVQHAEFGQHIARFRAISSDGATNPIS